MFGVYLDCDHWHLSIWVCRRFLFCRRKRSDDFCVFLLEVGSWLQRSGREGSESSVRGSGLWATWVCFRCGRHRERRCVFKGLLVHQIGPGAQTLLDPNPLQGSGPEPIPRVLRDQSGVVHGSFPRTAPTTCSVVFCASARNLDPVWGVA